MATKIIYEAHIGGDKATVIIEEANISQALAELEVALKELTPKK